MIIIGTKALSYYGNTIRDPIDTDIMVPQGSVKKYQGKGFDIIPVSQSVYNLLNSYLPFKDELYKRVPYATPDMVYTIKCSHLGWSNVSWQKHKQDILLLKKQDCKLIKPLYNALVNWWTESLGDKSFLSLDKSKEKFFTDFVEYEYDHDLLHELITHPLPPTYTKCLKDGEEVLIDKLKFDKLPFSEQVSMFREEITAIALERWYLKDYWYKRNITWGRSYSLALQKTITNLTKGWATDFIVLNLEHFILPDVEVAKKVIKLLNLEEKYMSKVDMTIFEEIMKDDLVEKDEHYSLDYVIHSLCEGDLDFINYDGDFEKYTKNRQDFKDKYGYEHLDQEGGGEGGSEYCYGIFRLGDKIYRSDYNYYSYHGYDYDGILDTLKEVTPKQKTITVYE